MRDVEVESWVDDERVVVTNKGISIENASSFCNPEGPLCWPSTAA